jgi:undecaprenyl-diphosphatase
MNYFALGGIMITAGLLYKLLVGLILGVVQGVSEWLPVSSKTQIIIASTYLIHITFQQAYTFGLFMELGAIIAAVIYFRRELLSLIRVLIGKGTGSEKKLFVYVVVATVITGIIGVPLYLFADSLTGISLGIPMMIVGLILIVDSLLIGYSKKRQREGTNRRKLADLKMKDYVLVGIAQGIAALPGVSRSGTTTSAMLLMNVEPDEAFRLSFVIGIFAAAAAFLLTIVVSHTNVTAVLSIIGTSGLVVAILTATVVSLFLIDFLIKIARKSKIAYLTAALGIIAILGGIIIVIFGGI